MRSLLLLCLSGSALLAQEPDPAVLQGYAAQGEEALAAARYEEAARAYEKLRLLSPGTAEVHARLGLIYFQERDYTRAVPALRQALKLKPGLPKADVLLGMSLSELGQFKEALPALQKGFRQTADPTVRRLSGLQLMRAHTGLGQDARAVEVALEMSRLYAKDPEVLYHSGRLFANFAYLQTMELARVAPGSVWLHQAAGEANESQGLFDAAVREYREVLALEPRRAGIHFRIGRALLSRAQQGAPEAAAASTDEATKEFEDELRLDPTNANASYELGEIHRKAGDLDRAREMFERAVERAPDFAEARIGLARVLIARQEPEPAVAHLQKAITVDPRSEVAYYQLSVAYGRLGRAAEQQQALAAFQRLHAAKRESEGLALTPAEVTRQELDSSVPPP